MDLDAVALWSTQTLAALRESQVRKHYTAPTNPLCRITNLCYTTPLLPSYCPTLTQYALLPASIAAIVQHALGSGASDASKMALVTLLVDQCCLDERMPKGILVSVLAPVIDTVAFLLADPSLPVLKRAIQAAAAFYRIAFHTIASIPLVDVSIWLKLAALKTQVLGFWTSHASNDGVRANVIKFLQCVVLVQSTNTSTTTSAAAAAAAAATAASGNNSGLSFSSFDVSLDACPASHPYLNPVDLQRESLDVFGLLLAVFKDSPACSGGLMTASINAIFPIVKFRPIYSATAVQALIACVRNPPSHLSPLQYKNVERAIRNEFLAILGTKLPEVTQFIPTITEILINQGVKGYEIAMRVKARDQGKRQILEDPPTEPFPIASTNVSVQQQLSVTAAPTTGLDLSVNNFNVTAIPLPVAVDAVVHSMATISQDVWISALTRFGEALIIREQNISMQSANLRSASVLDSSINDVKMKFDADENVRPEKRESMSNDLSYALDSITPRNQQQPPPAMPAAIFLHEPEFSPENVTIVAQSTTDKLETWKDAVARILDLEPLFDLQNSGLVGASGEALEAGMSVEHGESLVAARTGWMLVLVRLVTDGRRDGDDGGEDGRRGTEEWEFAVLELRQRLFDFVVESFRIRYELAILWLHEEYHIALAKSRKLEKVATKKSKKIDSIKDDDDDDDAVHNPFDTYEALFYKILNALKGKPREEDETGVAGLDPKDRTFTKFLIDVPLVTQDALDVVVKEYCEDSER
ncbi:hypothetical protein HK100_007451 [Physocladia obscura]|uniref:Symplekin/Pta1 N-terminal domain-containing protein n=1 Tax=Physocladia obscura TaxID=109957 RepID=A0AAD5X8A0_9FUNG|nr:hypothetical protein HK100_007451 [Physocladia obscura]